MVDWSLLPKDLLELINGRFETCFEAVHLRSVCSLWVRPYLGRVINTDLALTTFSPFSVATLGISQSTSDKHKLVWSLPGFGFTSEYGKVLNTLSSQIIPLGHNYMINFNAITTMRYRTMRRNFLEKVAFLPLDSEDGGDFTLVAGVGRVFVIEPSLEVSEIHSVTQAHECYWEALVVSGDDELLLVQRFSPGEDHDEHVRTWFRIFRLEEENQRRWVRVSDLVERVVFLGINWNFCYLAKEVPGVKGNCVMFIQPNTILDRILVFDLGTRNTTQASTVCRGMGMGMLGENKESNSFCNASS
ncbi:hypothetical protein F2Q70_00000908 [Brassica cretica]|uniref:KIB1-4 beta-propeller domain-containing protein n=1 Tax=Brassica cretica TaxID=69181 RepID=A0A8S9IZL6_BRACR|nr:hypothetical protein F2Q70_00000908 [Brassica cretica]